MSIIFQSRTALHLSLTFHDLDIFKECRPVILQNIPQFGFSDAFSFRFSLCIFGRNIAEMMLCFSQYILLGDTRCQFVPLLVI